MSKIMITFEIGKEGSGPFQSHKRIIESSLSDEYQLQPLFIRRFKNDPLRRKMIKDIVRQINAFSPDVVHFHGLQIVGYVVSTAIKKCHVKGLMVIRGSSLEAIELSPVKRKLLSILEKATLRKVDFFYCVSKYVNSWTRLTPYSNKNLGVVYNFSAFNAKKENITRHSLGFKETDFVFVSSGRINKEKGFDVLLNLIVRLKDYGNIKFLILGDGEYVDHMRQVLSRNCITSTLLIGYTPNVMGFLEISNAFLMCSKHETFCNSIVEALSVGLPVLATNVGGIPELVANEKNGLLFELGDEKGLFDKALLLANDDCLCESMGKESIKRYNNSFSKLSIERELNRVYQEVLSR